MVFYVWISGPDFPDQKFTFVSKRKFVSFELIVNRGFARRLRCCTNRGGQSSGLCGDIVDSMRWDRASGASVSVRASPFIAASANLFLPATCYSGGHVVNRAVAGRSKAL